ncbi:B12-binding domain-containing radical SAM protein [Magnetospirillum sp. UT-4]|uniref:B12-binding domain-containing radical SAM protein n=1 Tax=Magnetospirillum sp. UT-4 TaxID=2681467 RepID=UPI00137F5201|nr:radical SAM protein [Magnetospirillum sp. UT-4]CAA7612146.1 putative enzyme [Magnetospirillum sp. UT-4]
MVDAHVQARPDGDYKVLLVQPSDRHSVQSLFTFHKGGGLGHKPPQGILNLATYLIHRGIRNVECLDAQLDDLDPEATADAIARQAPRLVGITAWTDFWYSAWKTAQEVRRRLPQAVIVLGGPHCSVYPEESLRFSCADFLVSGDGEETLHHLVSRLAQGLPAGDLPGLWRKEDGQILPPTVRIATLSDITAMPVVDRTLLPFRRYTSVLSAEEFETTMITSRGCPYKCVFCKMDVQKVYARSAEQVVEEFRQIAELGITDVQVYDDTFTWGKQRVIDICNGLIENRINVRWAIRDRANRADPETYALMRRAGCYRIHFGIESGSPAVLKNSGKFLTLEQAEHALKLAKSCGFHTMAYYMFGFLDETYEDAMKTIDLALKLDADYGVFAVLIPYPGTAIYDQALERGIIATDHWRDFTRNPVPDYAIPQVIENILDRRTLLALKNKALRRYYFRPRRILHELRTLTSARELSRKAQMALTIARDVFAPGSAGR